MDNLDNFKLFVKNNPTFATYIKDGSMTWQKFYEIYDMYGENSPVWDEYKQEKKKSTTINDIVNMAKNIDVDKKEENIFGLRPYLYRSGSACRACYAICRIFERISGILRGYDCGFLLYYLCVGVL